MDDTDANGELLAPAIHAHFDEDRLHMLEHSLAHAHELLAESAQAAARRDAECDQLRHESAVLKRGIAIQNARQREAYEQNAQLQDVLARAAEHIAGLERTVQLLQVRLAHAEGGGGGGAGMGGSWGDPRPPPDVF